MSEPSLQSISEMRGLSGPLLFAVDTESMPGCVVCHFARVETVELTVEQFESTTFRPLTEENDRRVSVLADVLAGED